MCSSEYVLLVTQWACKGQSPGVWPRTDSIFGGLRACKGLPPRAVRRDNGPTGSCYHKPAGDCLASGDSDDETDEFTLDAAAVVAEEAVERKEARRVKPWLSELDVPEWQELAGDRLGWRKMLKSTKIRT